MHGQQNDKYTEMHGQQNDKYTEMHGQQNDKYTEMHGQQNFKKNCIHVSNNTNEMLCFHGKGCYANARQYYSTDILIYCFPFPSLFIRSLNSSITLVFIEYVGFVLEQILLYIQSLLPNLIKGLCDNIIHSDGRNYVCA